MAEKGLNILCIFKWWGKVIASSSSPCWTGLPKAEVNLFSSRVVFGKHVSCPLWSENCGPSMWWVVYIIFYLRRKQEIVCSWPVEWSKPGNSNVCNASAKGTYLPALTDGHSLSKYTCEFGNKWLWNDFGNKNNESSHCFLCLKHCLSFHFWLDIDVNLDFPRFLLRLKESLFGSKY